MRHLCTMGKVGVRLWCFLGLIETKDHKAKLRIAGDYERFIGYARERYLGAALLGRGH